jgi:hypothetical protein
MMDEDEALDSFISETGLISQSSMDTEDQGRKALLIILEIIVGVSDPGWDKFPITPLGIALWFLKKAWAEGEDEGDTGPGTDDGFKILTAEEAFCLTEEEENE